MSRTSTASSRSPPRPAATRLGRWPSGWSRRWRPRSVQLRLRGRDPEFVVTPPPADPSADDLAEDPDDRPPAFPEGDEGTMSRINLRMPDHLKARIEQAAASEGLSVNAWLVRAAAAALERTGPSRRPERRASQGAQRYTGWVR